MTVPSIERRALNTPGDVLARPHANCDWVIPGQVLAGEYPGSVVAAAGAARVDALLDAGVRQFIDRTAVHEGRRPTPGSCSSMPRRGPSRSRIDVMRFWTSACRGGR